jgi:hypothetical protein
MNTNKPLYGITGTKNLAARNARNTICNRLNLLHTNIKQPVFKALSAQTKYSEYELEHHVNLYNKLAGQEYSAIELFSQIECAFLEQNPNALTAAAEEDILSKKIIAQHSYGYLVSGIDSDIEAQWLRECGGTLIHIIDKSSPHLTPAVYIEHVDFIVFVTNQNEYNPLQMQAVVNHLYSQQTKEAA